MTNSEQNRSDVRMVRTNLVAINGLRIRSSRDLTSFWPGYVVQNSTTPSPLMGTATNSPRRMSRSHRFVKQCWCLPRVRTSIATLKMAGRTQSLSSTRESESVQARPRAVHIVHHSTTTSSRTGHAIESTSDTPAPPSNAHRPALNRQLSSLPPMRNATSRPARLKACVREL